MLTDADTTYIHTWSWYKYKRAYIHTLQTHTCQALSSPHEVPECLVCMQSIWHAIPDLPKAAPPKTHTMSHSGR